MLEVIFNLFVLCLSIVGLVEIFRIISMSFLTKKEFSENALLLIPIYGHNAKIEMILRNAITNAKWLNGANYRQIICLNLGMDNETRKICEIFSEEFDFIEIYSLKEFNEVMQQAVI